MGSNEKFDVRRPHNCISMIIIRIPFPISFKQNLVKDEKVLEIYQEAEKRSRLITKWTTIVFVSDLNALSISPSFFFSLYSMWHGNYNTDTWVLSVKFFVPFDTSTVFGWYMELLLEASFGCACVVTLSVVLTWLVSCCIYVNALCDHSAAIFKKIDAKITVQQTDSVEAMKSTREDLKDLILFHVKLME